MSIWTLNVVNKLRSSKRTYQCTSWNVNVHVYSPDVVLSWAECTVYNPGTGGLSLHSHHLVGELIVEALCVSTVLFAAAMGNEFNLVFSFHQVPITAELAEAGWAEKFAQYFYTWPALGIKLQTFWSSVQHPIHLATCSQVYENIDPIVFKLNSDTGTLNFKQFDLWDSNLWLLIMKNTFMSLKPCRLLSHHP